MLELPLNKAQKEAVTIIDQPLLVLSGAGSGKTRVITYKIAYLVLDKKVPLSRILALTFTNKAAREMRERAISILQQDPHFDRRSINRHQFFISTFHSNCMRILRDHAPLLGYKNSFGVIDEKEKTLLLKNLIKENHLLKLTSMDKVKEHLDKYKNDFQEASDIRAEATEDLFLKDFAILYEIYHQKLLQMNLMDFDDLQINVVKLFYQHQDIREFWQNQFEYILVDEFQDTNSIQYLLLKLLMKADESNLTMVGDDDQSIYSFRGASIANILNLNQEFENLKTIRIEQNYRSYQPILDIANHVILNNQNRLGKTLSTTRESKEPTKPYLFIADSDNEEAFCVVENIKDYQERYEKIAIIYRTNAQSRVFETELMKQRIPYVLLGARRFYERREIKDLVAYLKVISNPDDDLSLKRIINTPHRGVGEGALKKIQQLSPQDTLFSILSDTENWKNHLKIPQKTLLQLENFYNILVELKELSLSNPSQVLSLLIDSIDYEEYLKGLDQGESRHLNIQELKRSYEAYFKEDEEASFENFMAKIELQDSSDTLSEEGLSQSTVFLATVHGCKGLEFDVVFLVGLVEEIFPHYLSVKTKEDLEEERRLFYVAVTRAKDLLCLSYPKTMFLRGNRELFFKSRFLDEIPPTMLEVLNPDQPSQAKSNRWFDDFI